MNNFLIAIGTILLVSGIKMVYDARPIVKQYFSFGQENEAVLGMKILGFLFAVIGGIFLYFNL